MTFLMPLESEISELESSLTPELWSDYLEAQVGQERPVSLPKFKFETEAPLNTFFKERATQILYQDPDLS
jgi:serine protease inhibitor